MLGLNMRKIKCTPLKVVLSGWDIIGIFDKHKFYDRNGMTEKHMHAANVWHASTFKERLDHPQGANYVG